MYNFRGAISDEARQRPTTSVSNGTIAHRNSIQKSKRRKLWLPLLQHYESVNVLLHTAEKTYFLTSHGQLCAPSSSPAGAEDFPLVAPAPAFSILMLEARKFGQEKFGPDPKAGTHPWPAMAGHGWS